MLSVCLALGPGRAYFYTESFIQGIIDYTLRVVCGHYSSSWRRARYMHACLLAVWLVGTWESLQRA